MVELFAGAGNVSKVFRQRGKRVASFDTAIDESMDFSCAAGFARAPYNIDTVWLFARGLQCGL